MKKDFAFDTLLAAACGEVRKENLAALDNLTPEQGALYAPMATPRCGAVKRRRVVLAAAVAVWLALSIGVAAAWPELRWEFRDGRVYERIDNAPAQVERRQMTFGYLPEGYTVSWLDGNAEGEHDWAEIRYQVAGWMGNGRTVETPWSLHILQRPLREEMGYHTGADGRPAEEETWAETEKNFPTYDSVQDIPADVLDGKHIVRWLTPQFMYQLSIGPTQGGRAVSAVDSNTEEILLILQGIAP